MGGIIKTISNKLRILIIVFLGFCMCAYAQTEEDIQVTTMNLDETEQGIVEEALPIDETAFLIGEDLPEDAQGSDTQTSTVWLFVRMVLVLGLVIAAIYGIVFVLKKGFLPREVDNPYLKKAASLRLGPDKTVHVITMPDKAWVVGVSDAGINLIGEITDKDLVDQMILEADKAPTQKPKDFASILSAFSHTAKNTETTLKKQRERLKGGGRYE